LYAFINLSLSVENLLTSVGLFTFRKKGQLPTGEKITLLKVGGRTSAVVPSLQKKTGAAAGEIDSQHTDAVGDVKDKVKPTSKGKSSGTTIAANGKKRKATDDGDKAVTKKENIKVEKKENVKPILNSRRRSGRLTDN
jgi:hypothetical protein